MQSNSKKLSQKCHLLAVHLQVDYSTSDMVVLSSGNSFTCRFFSPSILLPTLCLPSEGTGPCLTIPPYSGTKHCARTITGITQAGYYVQFYTPAKAYLTIRNSA